MTKLVVTRQQMSEAKRLWCAGWSHDNISKEVGLTRDRVRIVCSGLKRRNPIVAGQDYKNPVKVKEYNCGGCGLNVNLMPCVVCTANKSNEESLSRHSKLVDL